MRERGERGRERGDREGERGRERVREGERRERGEREKGRERAVHMTRTSSNKHTLPSTHSPWICSGQSRTSPLAQYETFVASRYFDVCVCVGGGGGGGSQVT